MDPNELTARIEKAAAAGFIQSLNNLGYNDEQIKAATAVYPKLLVKRANDRYNLVRALVLNAI